MFNKVENIKDEIILMTLSEIVPKDHFLRKVDKAIDFIIDKNKSWYYPRFFPLWIGCLYPFPFSHIGFLIDLQEFFIDSV